MNATHTEPMQQDQYAADAPVHEVIADLALSFDLYRAKVALEELVGRKQRTEPDGCYLESAIELALSMGLTADQLASAIWGKELTWAQVRASYARGQNGFREVWEKAGYSIYDTGSFCLAAGKTVDGVLFLVTSLDGNALANPDFACLVGAYTIAQDYLNYMKTLDGLQGVEQALLAMAAEVIDSSRC